MAYLATVRIIGSSPRMWGTLLVSAQGRWVVRFIPTHVGNTRMSFRPRTPSSVHPHACGEHSVPSYSAVPFGGSSPRMWGTRVQAHLFFQGTRFIPTHVGNTLRRAVCVIVFSVHPHACGEHWWMICYRYLSSGSSPRMWGTPGRHRQRTSELRFIPTHVGNT